MDDKTLTALKGSIRKWEKIVAGKGVDEGMDNCPLCQLYKLEDDSLDCSKCPVVERVGEEGEGCNNTPYIMWYDYCQEQNDEDCIDDNGNKKVGDKRSLMWTKRELKFLKGLLPKGVR